MEPFFTLGRDHPSLAILATVPHSGEWLPPEAAWLAWVSSEVLRRDVDRYVHELYRPAFDALPIPAIVTRVHRYVVDLNRYAGDVDCDSVQGAGAPSGTHTKGLHWVTTTIGEPLIQRPIDRKLHDEVVARYHAPFFARVEEKATILRGAHPNKGPVYHLDCHSMPSQGTALHADQGKSRPDVVISDVNGKSASARFKDAVMEAFKAQGLTVSYNWPYQGGRITQRFGRPAEGHETIQIELNRKLYMNERTGEKSPGDFEALQKKLVAALASVALALEGGP